MSPNSSLASLARETFDHVPLMAAICTQIPKRASFLYDTSWGLHERFRSIISSAWMSTFRPNSTARMVARFRLCRVKCKSWVKHTPPCSQREKDCCILINLVDIIKEGIPLSLLEGGLQSLTMDALHLSVKERSIY
jgi:hypothetical protein